MGVQRAGVEVDDYTMDRGETLMDSYTSLAARAAVLAKNATDARDIEFWSTYAIGMARQAANEALAASVWIETSKASDAFRSMKLAAIRQDVAYSWEATR